MIYSPFLGWMDKCEVDVFLQHSIAWKANHPGKLNGFDILDELIRGSWGVWNDSGPEGVLDVRDYRETLWN